MTIGWWVNSHCVKSSLMPDSSDEVYLIFQVAKCLKRSWHVEILSTIAHARRRHFSGNLPDPGFQLLSPVSPAFQEDSFTSEPPGKPDVGV